jgi:hypothetical protein
MPDRTTDRRREAGRGQADPARAHRGSNSVLALQRSIGNRAVAQVLARDPVRTGTVEIHGIGAIKVKGGNLGDWAGTATLDTVDVTSEKGPQAKKLEQMANARTKSDVKVTIAPTNEAGEHLSVGSFTQLDIKDARVKAYTVTDDGVSWSLGDFTDVHRTKVTHKIS